MRKIKVAILGQGRSGRGIHAHSLIKLVSDKYEIVAVCDPIIERCNETKADTGCDVYSDYKELLKRKDIDIVLNITPSNKHVSICREILEAGFNVLTDKPAAEKPSEIDELIELAKKKGKLYAIFQQSRFAPYYAKVREVIDSGVLGRIVCVKIAFNGFARRWDWQTLQYMIAGNLFNTGPHPLDQALQFFGGETPSVFCLMDQANVAGDAEDHVKMILTKKGKPYVDLEVSSCCAYAQYTYQVYGANGGLTGDMKKIEWKYFDPAENPMPALVEGPMPDRAYCTETLKWKNGEWKADEEEANTFDYMARRFYDRLYETLANGAPLAITPEQVRMQIAVIEEAHRQNPIPAKYGKAL